jgi:hypothetical protein
VRTQQKYNLVQHPSLPADVMTKQVMVEIALNLSNDIVARLQAIGGGAVAVATPPAAAPVVSAAAAQPAWRSWTVDGHEVGVPRDMDVPNSDVVQAIMCVVCSLWVACGRARLRAHYQYHHRHMPHSRTGRVATHHRTAQLNPLP